MARNILLNHSDGHGIGMPFKLMWSLMVKELTSVFTSALKMANIFIAKEEANRFSDFAILQMSSNVEL